MSNYTFGRSVAANARREMDIMPMRLNRLISVLGLTLLTFVSGVAVSHAGNPECATKSHSGQLSHGQGVSAPVVERGRPRYPIPIPPASQIRSLLRRQEPGKVRSTGLVRPQPARSGPNRIRSPGMPVVAGRRCNRAIPTRQEFRNMLKNNPADTNEILRRCQINTSTLSPLRQLPVGARQLPEDTRQRPVGTWGR